MDLIQRIFSVGDPVKMVSCLLFCLLVPILCDCKPNGANVIAEQASNMKSYMDNSTEPCDDFYKFACGKWDTIHKLPEDKMQFSTLELTLEQAMNDIEQLLKSPDMPANLGEVEDSIKKAKQFYASCINTANIEKLAKESLKKLIENLGGWPAINSSSDGDKDWLNVLVETRKLGEQLLFFSEVSQDLYNSSRNTLYAYHPYLGLQSRHDFEKIDGKKKKALEAYEKLIAGILKHFEIDDDHIKEEVGDIVKFETDLAAISTDSVEIKNLTVSYNPAILEDLIGSYPEIDWLKYYSTLHDKSVNKSEIIIASKNYLKDLVILIKGAKSKTIINYLLWRIVQKFAPFAGSTFDREFEAFNKDTIGTTKIPRKAECTKYAIEYMKPAVGFLYVQTHFDKEAKQDANNLLQSLKKNFRILLEKNKWLDTETKAIILEKLSKMAIKIGYPNNILEPSYLKELYKDVSIKEDDFFSNILALSKLKSSQESKKIGTLVGEDHWDLDFLSANAQYPYPANAIFITALMFRPPLYHKDFPKFLNYGLLGTTTAHEMSHAFDGTGIFFDQNGNMQSWFSNSSLTEFTNRTKCFIDKYNNLRRGNSTFTRGEKILSEAISDDVGIKTAFTAYKEWIDENKNSPDFSKEVLPGFDLSKEKMFFLSFAQLYCNSIHEESWPSLWETENHVLANYRVNTVLSNSKYFAETFGCSSDSAMNNSTETCEVW